MCCYSKQQYQRYLHICIGFFSEDFLEFPTMCYFILRYSLSSSSLWYFFFLILLKKILCLTISIDILSVITFYECKFMTKCSLCSFVDAFFSFMFNCLLFPIIFKMISIFMYFARLNAHEKAQFNFSCFNLQIYLE